MADSESGEHACNNHTVSGKLKFMNFGTKPNLLQVNKIWNYKI